MAGGAPDPPKPIDPNVIIQAQEQANRINKITPFGSQIYGPNGLETKLDPKMQSLVDKDMSLAGQNMTPLSTPAGFGQLQNSLMTRLQSPNAGAKGGLQQLPQMQQMAQGFAGNPMSPNTMSNPLMQDAMQRIARGQS